MNRIVKRVVWVVSMVSLVGCSKPKADSTALGKASSAKVVNLAIWSNYVTPELLAEFEQKTGVKVQVTNYSSNEELLAKLQAGASGYDVAVPSDYMVFVMTKLNLLEKLDLSKISHYKSLDPRVLNKSFDPKNEYSVPFGWGTTGIAVNRALFKGEIHGWKDLFENKELSGKFTLLDDVRETLGAALKMEAMSLNTTATADLEKAKAELLKVKPNVKGFTSETLAGLLNGEMVAAHAYSCDANQAVKKSGGKIQYIIPKEGFTLWIDNLVIPAGSEHVAEAHKLIDFLLEPKVAAYRAENNGSAPSNKDAIALLPKELRENKSMFPDETTLAKAEMIHDLGENLSAWDRIWTEVKASK